MIDIDPTSYQQLSPTRLKLFRACPRQYFFSNFFRWETTSTSIHLVHGSAWHIALEFLLLNGVIVENVGEAHRLYTEYFRQFFPEQMDLTLAPKSPPTALAAIKQYVARYEGEHEKSIAVEQSGTLPLDDEFVLNLRIDNIQEDKYDNVDVIEHKTTKSAKGKWPKQWHLDVAVGAYLTWTKVNMPDKNVRSAIINGTVFQKRSISFMRLPVTFSPDNYRVWHCNALRTAKQIKHEFELLSEASSNDLVLKAFPLNELSCHKYGEDSCPFRLMCESWANPLAHQDRIPADIRYREKFTK